MTKRSGGFPSPARARRATPAQRGRPPRAAGGAAGEQLAAGQASVRDFVRRRRLRPAPSLRDAFLQLSGVLGIPAPSRSSPRPTVHFRLLTKSTTTVHSAALRKKIDHPKR